MSRKLILTPIILPLLGCSFLLQTAISMLRILTTYGVLETGAGVQAVGVISAVFAILPVLLTIQIGRLNDRGGVGHALFAGSGCVLTAALVLWLAPAGMATFLIGNAILGIGHTLVLSALQMVSASASSRVHRDAVIGNFMVAMGLGHVVGPLVVGASPTEWALALAAVLAVLLLILGVALVRRMTKARATARARVSLAAVAATPGLWWIILLGSFTIATQDMILAFLPVLGAERGLPQWQIGVLLSIRATAAMVSRVLYGRAVSWLGRMRLTLIATVMGGLGVLTLMLDVPLLFLALSNAAAGFGLGITLTSSVVLTMLIAPRAVRGTALSLRLTANRIAQFGIPLGAGIIVPPLGAGGVFGLCGAALLGIVIFRPLRSSIGNSP